MCQFVSALIVAGTLFTLVSTLFASDSTIIRITGAFLHWVLLKCLFWCKKCGHFPHSCYGIGRLCFCGYSWVTL